MRKLSIVTVLALLVSGLAWAAQTSATYIGTTAAPSGASAGVTMTGDTVKRLSVTVTDFRDGGTGDAADAVKNATLAAWVFQPSNVSPDGGQGWARVPQLDLTLDGGASSDQPALQGFVTLDSYPGIAGSRLMYQTTYINAGVDAGALVHKVTITQQQ